MRTPLASTPRAALIAAAGILGCASSPPTGHAPRPSAQRPATTADAGDAADARGRSTASHDADATQPAPPAAPALALTREALELVAVGKTPGAKILWLSVHGSRVWLSGRNVDALADGDGPLVTQPDPLAGLPYQAGKHALVMAGTHPHLYVLRYERREVPSQPASPVVFVRTARGWTQAKPLKDTLLPVAFLPWGQGALVVHSQIGPSIPAGLPSYAPERPGTELQYIAPDGAVSDPGLAIDRRFLAWSADSDGKTLSLFGTVRTDRGDEDPEFSIEVARGTTGTLKSTVVFRTTQFAWAEMSRASVREHGATALVLPPNENTEGGSWRPDARTAYEVGAAAPRLIAVPGNTETCRLGDAILDGGTLLAIESCIDSDMKRLLRVGAGAGAGTIAATVQVILPGLAKDTGGFRVATPSDKAPLACEPTSLALRAPGDLWVVAACASSRAAAPVPAVFRRGHAQKVVVGLP